MVEMSCGDEICLLTFLKDFLREILLVRNGGVGMVPSPVPLSARVAALVCAAMSSSNRVGSDACASGEPGLVVLKGSGVAPACCGP